MSSLRRVRIASLGLSLVLLGIPVTSAAGVSSTTTEDDNVVTQEMTLNYNQILCGGNIGYSYAFTSWRTVFTRVPKGNREIDYVWSRVAIGGSSSCTGAATSKDTGEVRYFATFGSANIAVLSKTLSWPSIHPILFGSAMSQRSYLTQRGGGSVISHICTNITIANNGNYCSQL